MIEFLHLAVKKAIRQNNQTKVEGIFPSKQILVIEVLCAWSSNIQKRFFNTLLG